MNFNSPFIVNWNLLYALGEKEDLGSDELV